MKRLEISLLLSLVFCAALSICALNTECSEIRSSVLRLHILANSDCQEDQSLKLKVRDRLLEVGGDVFSGAKSREEAEAAAKESLDMLRQEAQE